MVWQVEMVVLLFPAIQCVCPDETNHLDVEHGTIQFILTEFCDTIYIVSYRIGMKVH